MVPFVLSTLVNLQDIGGLAYAITSRWLEFTAPVGKAIARIAPVPGVDPRDYVVTLCFMPMAAMGIWELRKPSAKAPSVPLAFATYVAFDLLGSTLYGGGNASVWLLLLLAALALAATGVYAAGKAVGRRHRWTGRRCVVMLVAAQYLIFVLLMANYYTNIAPVGSLTAASGAYTLAYLLTATLALLAPTRVIQAAAMLLTLAAISLAYQVAGSWLPQN